MSSIAGSGGPVVLLYGSQTGTAQDLAESLRRRLSGRGVRSLCYGVDELPSDSFAALLRSSAGVLWVVATAGDGEAPSNMKSNWRWLRRRSLPATLFGGVPMSVFGLGDSSYAKFNAAARRLATRLSQLGAATFGDAPLLSMGNDQAAQGVYGAFEEWCGRLFPGLRAAPADPQPLSRFVIGGAAPPSFEADAGAFYRVPHGFLEDAHGPAPAGPLLCRVRANDRITPEDWIQETRHLRLAAPSLSQRGGDVSVIFPENARATVDEFEALLRSYPKGPFDLSMRVSVAAAAPPEPGFPAMATRRPRECTLRDLAVRFLDLGGTPRRSFFERLCAFASNDEEREKLEELASPDGYDLLLDYCLRERRSHLDVLREFPSARPPLELLCDMIPPIWPREFSVASSAVESPGLLDLCVGVLRKATPYGRVHEGLCSTYLARRAVGDVVRLFLRRGPMRHSAKAEDPVVCVGAGTGIAPMRSLLRERRALRLSRRERGGGGAESGPSEAGGAGEAEDLLVFGCRRSDKDFYYASEWAQMEREAGGAFRMAPPAFSREGSGRVYVQARLRDAAVEESVWRMLWERRGALYVCGSNNGMPRDVVAAVKAMARGRGSMDEAAAAAWLKQLEREGRLVIEAW